MQHGATQDHISEGIGERHRFDLLEAEVGGRERGGKLGAQGADGLEGFGIPISGDDLITFAEESDEVASGAAPGVEEEQAGGDAAAEELIEQVDVDGAELGLKSEHGGILLMIRDRPPVP